MSDRKLSFKNEEKIANAKFQVGNFSFLSHNAVNKVTYELFKELLKNQVLTSEDQEISKEIIDSLKKNGKLPFHWSPQESDWLKNNELSRWLEYILFRFKFRLYPERKIVSKFPLYLLVEPASACNLRCPMCFQSDKSFTKKEFMGVMELDVFTRIVDEAVEGGTKAMTLASRGEPTLNKDFGKMMHYASKKFLELKIITNATKLTEKLSHDILSSEVDLLVFSIDAHTKDIYEKYRPSVTGKGNFEEVRDNVRRFHEIRKSHYPNSSLITRISGVQVGDDQDPDGFKDFWSPFADEVGMKKAMERWDTYNNELHPDLKSPCGYIWERMYIWYDGQTNVCDADYKTILDLGTISNFAPNKSSLSNPLEIPVTNLSEKWVSDRKNSFSTISEIWHGEKLSQLRTNHINGNRGLHEPCDRCGIS